jgi:hypothetical protein
MVDFNKSNLEIGSPEEKDELIKFKKSINGLQLEFINQLKNKLSIDISENDLLFLLNELNKIYCQKLIGLCDKPLENGVASGIIMGVLKMWVGSCLTSNAFKRICKAQTVDRLNKIVDVQVAKAKPDSATIFRVNLIKQHHDFYLPYVPETLGVARVVYAELIYDAMRKPDANVKYLWEKFEWFDHKILELGKSVGISESTNNRAMRTISGIYIEKYPIKSDIFRETAYNLVTRGEDNVTVYKIKKHNLNETYIKEVQYFHWDGDYTDETGEDFLLGFTPRVPASVNELRRRSKEAWDLRLSMANTPKEFVDCLSLSVARNVQKKYMRFMQIDNHLSDDDLTHLNDFMNYNDDVTWMIDIGGSNPFNTAGLSMNYVDFIRNGPSEEITEPMACNYSELKSAMCLWFNLHPDVSPYAFQAKANVLYKAYEKSGKMSNEIEQEIYDVLKHRDELFLEWAKAYSNVNHNLQDDIQDMHSAIAYAKTRPLPGESKPNKNGVFL